MLFNTNHSDNKREKKIAARSDNGFHFEVTVTEVNIAHNDLKCDCHLTYLKPMISYLNSSIGEISDKKAVGFKDFDVQVKFILNIYYHTQLHEYYLLPTITEQGYKEKEGKIQCFQTVFKNGCFHIFN